MKKLLLLVALAALVAVPAVARENVPYIGSYPDVGPSRSDIELEYDGGTFVAYGTSPNWTDETCVNFQIPDGGPFTIAEVRYYIIGTTQKEVHWWDSYTLSQPPMGSYVPGPTFTPSQPSWPPSDFTTVPIGDVTVNTGDIVAPGMSFNGNGDGIGLAYATADGNPGHSWAFWSGAWTDDTYGYGYDDGIRLGIDYGGGTPVVETTWGAVKNLYK